MNPLECRSPLAGGGLVLLSALALSQATSDSQDVKVVPVHAPVEDVKNEWIVPPAAAPADRVEEALLEAIPELAATELLDGPQHTLQQIQIPDFADVVLFDEPGDGALWVRGGNSYKARFDREVATYLPYFGPLTPRHFPVALALEEVLVGARPIDFERGVPYERLDTSVLYDRGSLVEHYELRADSMEQLFHFEHLPAAGDLLLRIALTTELEVKEGARGLELSNGFGQLSYSRAVVLDSAGRRTPAETRHVEGRIEIHVPAALLAQAAWPITIDPVLSEFGIHVDPSVHSFNPDVAFDQTHDRFVVVWEQIYNATDHDVYSLLLGADGVPIPASLVSIDFTTSCWQGPRVANNQIADQFLTVSQTSQDCSSPYTVQGRTRQAADNVRGDPFEISVGAAGDKIHPDVGGDPVNIGPTYYCVVWERVASATDHDIHYQLVRSDGTLLLPGNGLVDNSTLTLDRYPSVSKSDGQAPFATQVWNVAWEREVEAANRDIYAAQIRWDGTIVTPSFSVDLQNPIDHRRPQASPPMNGGYDPRGYFVLAFQPVAPGDPVNGWKRWGLRETSFMHSLSVHFTLPYIPPGNEGQLAMDYDGSRFVIANPVIQSGLYGIEVTLEAFGLGAGILYHESTSSYTLGEIGSSHLRLVSQQSGVDGMPSTPRKSLIVWEDVDISTGSRNVVGALLSQPGPPGARFCNGHSNTCPCGYGGSAGCKNSTGVGSRLTASGSNYISAGDLVLEASQALPGQPGIFFQGTTGLGFGSGVTLGNGRLCVGGSTVRLQIVVPDASGVARTTINVALSGGVSAGSGRSYQYWYRDSTHYDTCTSGFNFTNAYEVAWTF